MVSLDQSAFMVTSSGVEFHLLRPDPAEVRIEDIAHALSQLCRFTGHCMPFYSVGQHSLLVSRLVPPAFALEGLLHDAAEAYVGDLSRPLKHAPGMAGYREIEQRVDVAVRQAFGLPVILEPPHMSPEVKVVDNQIVVTEGRQLTANTRWTRDHHGVDVVITPMTPAEVEEMFLRRFRELTSVEVG